MWFSHLAVHGISPWLYRGFLVAHQVIPIGIQGVEQGRGVHRVHLDGFEERLAKTQNPWDNPQRVEDLEHFTRKKWEKIGNLQEF